MNKAFFLLIAIVLVWGAMMIASCDDVRASNERPQLLVSSNQIDENMPFYLYVVVDVATGDRYMVATHNGVAIQPLNRISAESKQGVAQQR